MSQEEEMLEVSPKELEFCFSQAARFGAFLQFLNENRPICREIFEKHMGSDFNPNEAFNLKDGRKKDAMMDIVHLFHKKGLLALMCWFKLWNCTKKERSGTMWRTSLPCATLRRRSLSR